jgi:hypothetical protein
VNKKYKKYFKNTRCRIGRPLNVLFGDRVILGAEVGVWKGKHSRKLLIEMPRLELVCIDMWDLHATRKNENYTNTEGKISRKMKNVEYGLKCYDAAKKTLDEFSSRCNILKTSSEEAARCYEDNYFDFVYIDACHKYEECKRDILMWLPKVKVGGYICGHDWNDKRHIKVKRAVKEVRRLTGFDLVGNKNKSGEWLMGPIQ